MKFVILSKDKARNFRSEQRYAVIGVVGDFDTHPTLRDGYVDRLQLDFFDVDIEHDIYPGITDEDAKEIIAFVEKIKNRVDMFVIHCNAGISRSSGIAAALSMIYDGTDQWVFSDPRYVPNMLVYRKILSAAEKIGLLK